MHRAWKTPIIDFSSVRARRTGPADGFTDRAVTTCRAMNFVAEIVTRRDTYVN